LFGVRPGRVHDGRGANVEAFAAEPVLDADADHAVVLAKTHDLAAVRATAPA
jgi:hypothetical protein